MRPYKCESCKKFFDADRFETCPHCSNTVSAKPVSQIKGPYNEVNVKSDSSNSEKDFSAQKSFLKRLSKNKQEQSVTPSSNNVNRQDDVEQGFVKLPDEEKAIAPVESTTEKLVEKVEEAEKTPEKEVSVPSLLTALEKTESTNNGNNQKTQAFYNFSNDIDPVVGWLVCIKGEYKGESFKIKSGRNYIGRSLTMDIALAQEKSVSRERHAAITFDPKQKKFFVQPGESNGLTYVNGELLMTFKEFLRKDIISLGECDLMFFPLCGEEFSWDTYE